MPQKTGLFIVAALGAVLLGGCPVLFISPFDTTGAYFGTWTTSDQTMRCPLTLELEQADAENPFDPAIITGTVDIDFSCLGGVFGLLDLVGVLDNVNLPVEGTLLINGTLELNTTSIADVCETGICTELAFLGAGVDEDNDGFMDSYEGTWVVFLRLSQTDSGLRALLESLGLGDVSEVPFPELLNFSFDALRAGAR